MSIRRLLRVVEIGLMSAILLLLLVVLPLLAPYPIVVAGDNCLAIYLDRQTGREVEILPSSSAVHPIRPSQNDGYYWNTIFNRRYEYIRDNCAMTDSRRPFDSPRTLKGIPY